MKVAGLKRKKIQINNIAARIEQRYEEFDNSTTTLDNKLHDILEGKGYLFS